MAYERNFFLIDTENTGVAWITALPELKEKDRVFLFYTEKSPVYRSTDIIALTGIVNKLEWIFCVNGSPNALDFQLVTWMGSQIEKAPKTSFFIMSNDHGYDAVCEFWRERGIKIRRLSVQPENKGNEDSISPDKNIDIVAIPVSKKTAVPKKAKEKIKSMMKNKYISEENITLAYQSLISGKKEEIHKAVHRIAGDSADADKMERHWLNCIRCIQKISN